jgi:hypothetical protein
MSPAISWDARAGKDFDRENSISALIVGSPITTEGAKPACRM